MIVTLAGHVDHGKTTLVGLLTGQNTDRLVEEQRRGLTIDLGFAYTRESDQTLGFVDVPGHHRFIHNMVAGVAARQHALLVIAADDGPMPQSREHLQILELIGVAGGVIALSKCDRVSPERIASARAEVAGLVAGTFLEGAPVVETAAVTGQGISELRSLLLARAAQDLPLNQPRPFRLAVDRAFQLKGAGLVATGTVHAGEAVMDQTLYVFPGGAPARVRGLHAQNQAAERAVAGDRTALNLAGVDADDLARGHWLSEAPETGHIRVVVQLQVLDDFPRAVRHWIPIHVYHATTHATGHLALLEGVRLEPGATALVELELDQPLLAKRGDRLVIRDHGLERTLGGGEVVDNRSSSGRRRARQRLLEIQACALPEAGQSLDALLELGPLDLAGFQGLWNVPRPRLEAMVQERTASLRQGSLVSEAQWSIWTRQLQNECEHRHEQNPSLQGLRENDFSSAVPAMFRAEALKQLVADGALDQRAGHFKPRSHQAVLSAAEQSLLERLQPHIDQPQPPSLGDLAKTLGLPIALLQKSTKALASKGVLVLISDKRLYLPEYVAALADTALALSERGPFTARDFRDAAGIGRNIAIDVLEYFDARGYTRRNGDTRTVTGERSRVATVPR